MPRTLKLAIVLLALAGIGLAFAAFLFIYPKYREYQRVADSFDLAELDNIPAISEVFDYAGMWTQSRSIRSVLRRRRLASTD